MKCDEGPDMQMRLEEGSIRTTPTFLACATEEFALYSEAEEGIKMNTSEVKSLILEMYL